MSSRRKEMFKLLYNLVNRGGADLNEVFTFVEEILCKDPSLIQSYSLNEHNNLFQDTLILWLINRLVRYLGDQHSETIHLANVKLQRKILTSCLVNRPALFECLIAAYTTAVSELCTALTPLDEDPNLLIDVYAFNSDEACLSEIDAEFSFEVIRVRLEDVDERVQALLNVLQHAFIIGYEAYPMQFHNSLPCVFLAFKECILTTKLTCLRYCNNVLHAVCTNCELQPALEYFYKLLLNALALLWAQLPLWQKAGVLRIPELKRLIEVSVDVLKTESVYVRQFAEQITNDSEMFQYAFNMLDIAAKLCVSNQPDLTKPLIDSLVDFTLTLKWNLHDELVASNVQQVDTLIHLCPRYPRLVRLLAASTVPCKPESSQVIYNFLIEKLCAFLEESNIASESWLDEIITSFMYIHHATTLLDLKSNIKSDKLCKFLKESEVSNNIQKGVNVFLDNVKKQQNAEKTMCIAGQFLQCKPVRNILPPQMQHRLVNIMEQALNDALKPSTLCSAYVQAVARTFMMPLKFEINELHLQQQKIITNIMAQVFKTNSTLHHDVLGALRTLFCEHLGGMLADGLVKPEQILNECSYSPVIRGDTNLLAVLLRTVYCIRHSSVLVSSPYQLYNTTNEKYLQVVCKKCNFKDEKLHKCNSFEFEISPLVIKSTLKLPESMKSTLIRAMLSDKQYTFVANHLEEFEIGAEDIIQILTQLDMKDINLDTLRIIMPKISDNDENSLRQFANILYIRIKESLMECKDTAVVAKQKQVQQHLLQLIDCFAHKKLSENWLFQYFKLTFFYMVHPESQVVHDAVLSAKRLCQQAGLQPTQLWNWYKRDALSLIVQLVVYVYLRKGVRLIRSMRAFTMMLGFSCVQEFVCKYYRLLTTMLLPYCVKEPLCKGLLVGISKITRKSISTIFVASFLRIYTHVCLTETPEVANRCIELIVKCTDCSLRKLMHTDVKQTVAELLIYYNRNSEFVLRAFQCLLLHEPDSPASTSNNAFTAVVDKVPSKEFAKFIADRMLGVITYFETCLAEPNFEKPLKVEALESLGQIIRCIGPQHVTQFRFKIIAMLSFVLTLDDRQLQQICLKIWHIFLHIVDIHELGASLNRIVASLQPLLQNNQDEVNDIYEFIIVKNSSMLGAHIPDLYFIEDMPLVRPEISQCVALQTEILLRSERTPLLDKLAFYHRQITNEHTLVRIHGLRHLRQFIASRREELYRMVLQQINVDPLFESLLNALLAGCQHEDLHLQVAAAKCLGELGAIDPNYLLNNSVNKIPESHTHKVPLGVHTDEFAIMALTELCRAYHYQKDTKYVDNFSLAMQETLATCGVQPNEQKKLNVWQALPERMQQVMLPLLKSCYTASRRETRCHEQPIFASTKYRRYEDWAFAWVSRLIDCVRGEETQHLLNAYKPSMKRDNNMLSLFMPYVLLHALQEGSEAQVENMVAEFQAVFDYCNEFGLNENANNSNNFDEMEESIGVKEFPVAHNSKPIQELHITATPMSSSHSYYTGEVQLIEENVRRCTKLCSELVDFLARWQREWQQQNSGVLAVQAINADGTKKSKNEPALVGYKRVQTFLDNMIKLKIAKANYYSGEFARALLYLEEYIAESENSAACLQSEIPFLIQICGQLKEPDAVEGAAHIKQTSLELPMEILVNRILDRPQDLMTCYEQLLTTLRGKSGKPFGAEVAKGVLDCYLRLDTPETARLLLDGVWQACEDIYCEDLFKECSAELFWRLGRYDELEELVEQPVMDHKNNNSWTVQRAKAFLRFRSPKSENDDSDFESFVEMLDVIRSHVLSGLRTSATSVIAPSAIYVHSYEEVIKLQLLNDMEKCRLLACNMETNLRTDNINVCLDNVKRFFVDWQAQLRVLQPLARLMEPVLCFRRNLLIEMEYFLRRSCANKRGFFELQNILFRQESELWIFSAQINRAAGLLQQAQLSLMQCQKNPPPTRELEQAQLLWLKGEQSGAFKLLNAQLELLESRCDRNVRELPNAERALYAEAKYLQATYNAEAANICAELNLRQFREAIAGNRHSEKCHVQLAQYMERIYDTQTLTQKCAEHGRRLILDVMLNYAKSLRYGCENVYQSLPRLLGYWLDLSSQCSSEEPASTKAASGNVDAAAQQEHIRKMNDLISNCANLLPTALFYTAFSQLLSRICHPSSDVYNVLRVIIVKLVEHYPQQSLWMLLPVLKSSYATRIKRCQLILRDPRLNNSTFSKLLNDFNTLAERLIELTNKEATNVDCNYHLSTLVPQLPKLFEDSSFSAILLPFEKYMQASFPIATSGASLQLPTEIAMDNNTTAGTAKTSLPMNPFPYKQLYITGIDETVSVLRSAARPKKISFRCSDGHSYAVMVKPKDDLRKDFRLMEFNGLVKRYLHQDPDARQRRLRIRTYAAIPFNEECGLVEWLPRLNSFRAICTTIYRSRGLGMSDRQLRQYVFPCTDPIEKKRKAFLETLLPRHPPVFHEWLRQRFHSPHSWYEARIAYVRTIAVMSMVGYILGLGDRHGENVLFDETNGDAVHVDFNCLFNQGELFAYPELVPFRLTHNMTFAMGPLGIEGVFRKSCEITLRLLKRETQTLMSVLRPFVYDLVMLTRKNNATTSKKTANGAELTDPKALQDVRRIEERLKGYVKRSSANSMPLSVEGQVSFLIAEATNSDNLAAMYIGWGSYI